MHKTFIALVLMSGLLASRAPAQVTNVTFTELETFESQPDTVIVRGAGEIGSLNLGDINVTVICKESTDATAGRKEYGVAVGIAENNRHGARMVIDYDEMDALLNGLNYLAQIDSNATTLPTFMASYITRSGLRVGAFTNRRQGAIQYFLQDRSIDSARIPMTSAQLVQFRSLLQQARQKLDSLRTAA